jgi:hypothetical protein
MGVQMDWQPTALEEKRLGKLERLKEEGLEPIKSRMGKMKAMALICPYADALLV